MSDTTVGDGATPEPEVLLEQRGRLGLITLNRPRAINALTHGMVMAIAEALERWAADDGIDAVAIRGAGERGLCAGGDIVSLYHDARSGDHDAPADFWRDEYHLNAMIASYPKPYVAFMDGVTLGGGIGVSAHGSHRVVTERSRLGMPETTIGFIPDVGGTWLLSHAPGEVGTHLALTAQMIGAGDALAVGLADHFVHSDRLDALLADLETTEASEAIAHHSSEAPAGELDAQREWIDDAYRGDDLGDILARLDSSPHAAARDTAGVIATKSPTALAVALASLRRARELSSLEEALAQEYRVSLRSLASHDFVEGVRAQVIDKDRQPAWRPASLAEVSRESVEDYFAPLDDRNELFTTVRAER